MALDQKDKYLKMVLRGKYQRLYQYLSSLQAQEWRTSFSEVEAVIGFELPPSARLHRPWWGNQRGERAATATPSPGVWQGGRRRRSIWTARRCCFGEQTPSP